MTEVSEAEMVAAVRRAIYTGYRNDADCRSLRAVLAVLERHELEAKTLGIAERALETADEWMTAAIAGCSEANASTCLPRGYPAGLRTVKSALRALAALDTAGEGENAQ